MKKFILFMSLFVLIPSAFANPDEDKLFQSAWTPAFLNPLPGEVKYQPFQIPEDSSPGFHGTHVRVDINYRVMANDGMPEVPILVPSHGHGAARAEGTVRQGKIHMPTEFVLPDAVRGNTPNNPVIVINTDSKRVLLFNEMARPFPGGPVWGYKSESRPSDHGGSGTTGGDISLRELESGKIDHVVGIEVWGKRYLSHLNGGYVPPADRADSHYNVPENGNYYGGPVPNLTMGSLLAIPPHVTAKQLGIQSKEGQALLKAFKTYGACIVDNTGWDTLQINSTPEAMPVLMDRSDEIAKLFAALELVEPSSPSRTSDTRLKFSK